MYRWHLALNHNHVNTDFILRTLRYHNHPDAGRLRSSILTCSGCKLGNISRVPNRSTVHNVPPVSTLRTDISGPIELADEFWERYIATFTDIGSRYTFAMPLKKKIQAQQAITTAMEYTASIFGRPPFPLHYDNSKEVVGAAVREAAHTHVMVTRTTVPHNPEENGIAERVNRTLMTGTRCILSTAAMHQSYWPYSIRDMALKQAFLIHDSTGMCPYFQWHGHTITLPHLPVFGQIGFTPNLPTLDKLTDCGIACRDMSMIDLKQAVVQYRDGTNHKIHLNDFHSVNTAPDPTQRHSMAFIGYAERIMRSAYPLCRVQVLQIHAESCGVYL